MPEKPPSFWRKLRGFRDKKKPDGNKPVEGDQEPAVFGNPDDEATRLAIANHRSDKKPVSNGYRSAPWEQLELPDQTLPPEPTPVQADHSNFIDKELAGIDREKAERFGLEYVELLAGEQERQADLLLGRIYNSDQDLVIDIDTIEGQKEFMETWKMKCPSLPPPYSENNFNYLRLLKNKRIVKDFVRNANPVNFKFDRNREMWVMDTVDEKWNKNKQYSQLLLELFGELNTGNVNGISRNQIDQSLLRPYYDEQGHFKTTPSVKHRKIISSLGLNPEEHELRLPFYPEFIRLCLTTFGKKHKMGRKNIWTHLCGYESDPPYSYGLLAGYGGISFFNETSIVDKDDRFGVRLILVKKDS